VLDSVSPRQERSYKCSSVGKSASHIRHYVAHGRLDSSLISVNHRLRADRIVEAQTSGYFDAKSLRERKQSRDQLLKATL